MSQKTVTNTEDIYPRPVLQITPRVVSAVQAFTNWKRGTEMTVNTDEKGMLLLGVREGHKLVAKDVAIFPQKGSGGSIEWDGANQHAASFWFNLSKYLEKTGMLMIGWAHFYTGGIHHSLPDYKQDEEFSLKMREACPLFTSATFNGTEFGAEGKAWVAVPGAADLMQVPVPRFDIEFTMETAEREKILQSIYQKMECAVNAEFSGHKFILPITVLGMTDDDFARRCVEYLDANFTKFTSADNSLFGTLKDAIINEEIVKEIHSQLEAMWSPTYTTQGMGMGMGYSWDGWNARQHQQKSLDQLSPQNEPAGPRTTLSKSEVRDIKKRAGKLQGRVILNGKDATFHEIVDWLKEREMAARAEGHKAADPENFGPKGRRTKDQDARDAADELADLMMRHGGG